MKSVSLTQKQYVILVIILAALFTLGAAVYSYSGPNRTVVTQVIDCHWEKQSCQYVAARDDWRWHTTDTVLCSSESKPWLEGGYPGPCAPFSEGRTRWVKNESSTSSTVTYPSATVTATFVCASPGLNGWCAGGGSLNITSSEPVSGQQIIAIEGTRNTVSIACVGIGCNVPLLEGTNNFTYWAVSSFGDTSLMGTTNGLKQDSLAPQISGPTLTGSLSGSGWYYSAVSFNASATDTVSGLTSLTCTLDGSASACTGVTVSTDGVHTLVVQARDAAGNSSQKTASFSIDTQPPALDVQLSGTSGANGWYHSAQVSASATDSSPGSGLAALEYALDGGAWTSFAPTALGQAGSFDFPDGQHTLDVRAVDNAGNIKQADQIVAWVDSLAPSITLDTVAGTSGKNGWYVSSTQVGAAASDGTSGLDTFEYSLDNGAWTPYTSAITLSDGVHSIVYYARDTAGWVTQVVQSVKVDTHAPQISGSLAGTPGTSGWYISNAILTASAIDPNPASGMASFTYILDGGAETAYTTALTLTDGQHTVVLQAEDQAGLTDSFTQNVKVDTIAPVLVVSSVLPEWVQDTVTLNGTAADTGSGLLKIEISTNHGASWQTASGTSSWSYAWNTVPDIDGTHILHVRALDAAGLDTEIIFNAQVDNAAPIIELPGSWYIWDTVELNAYDTDSGLAEMLVEISDPDHRWTARRLTFAPGHLPVDLLWDRRFGDGTLAPTGDYDVEATAYDRLGNVQRESATIHIPWAAELLPAPATATPLSTPRPTATATATSLYPTPTRTPSPTPGAALLFGTPGSGDDVTPTPIGEPALRPTPTEQSFSSWLASVFLPPAADESVTDAGQGSDPQPFPAPGDPNLLFDAAAIAAVAGVTAYWAQKKKEEEEARQAAEAQRQFEAQAARQAAAADPHAAEAAAARRRRTARARRMSPLEAAAEKLKEAIAAVTQKEQKEWKAERYEQISQTDEYKNSDNKTQFMKQELENIKEQEAAYRKREREEAARLAAEEAARKAEEEATALLQALLAAQRAQQAAAFDADMTPAEKLAALRATEAYQDYTSRMADWEHQQQSTPGKGLNGLASPAPSRAADEYPWWDPRGWPGAIQKWVDNLGNGSDPSQAPITQATSIPTGYPTISILPSQTPTLLPAFTPTPLGEQCELPDPQTVPPDFMRTLNYGKDFVQFLAPETRGFWYADASKPYDARMQIAVGYYYEGSQFYQNADIGNAVTEAFARKYYYEANLYGSENGLYRALGTLQSIRDRIDTIRRNPDDPDIVLNKFQLNPGDYYNINYAYEQAERILNNPDPSWCSGILLNQPAAWGDFKSGSETEKYLHTILPEFVNAVTSENQGELSNQIYRVQSRIDGNEIRRFFVMTQGQINELCFGGSCVAPDPDYVNEQRRLREKEK